MRLRSFSLLVVLAAILLALLGCEPAGKKAAVAAPVKYIPPPPPPAAAPEAPAQKIVEPPAPPPQPDRVEILVAESEAAFAAGVVAYRSGHLERAKREFDRAVDILLTVPAELRSDARIEQQLEKLIDSIHHYELVALKEGDGFTERRPVPAPVDEIPELTFPPDPKLKEKVEREVKETVSDLPLVINDYVLGYINYFSSRGRIGVEGSLQRAGRYRDMVARILKEEGLPQDLIYVAQAESAFQPWALSRAGARGMWQFMAFTGRAYGLGRNWWVDDRQDPEKSTRAAARHLKDLYSTFGGDWHLAIAAYNSGAGAIQRAIQRTGYANFWELLKRNVLPRETKNYVPIILAATIVAKNPEKYGLSAIQSDPAIVVDTVQIASPTDLRLIAETIDCSVSLLQTLNPSLLRLVTPSGPFDLKLPAGTRERFLGQIALIPEDKRVFWRWHKVAPGESLAGIAARYKTTRSAISEVNNLGAEETLQAGAKLVIPVTVARDRDASGGGRLVRLSYRVRRGDTVDRVADRFGVTPVELRGWNRISGNRLAVGRRLVIHTVQSELGGPRAAARSRSRAKGASSRKSGRNRKLAAARKAPAQPARGAATMARTASR